MLITKKLFFSLHLAHIALHLAQNRLVFSGKRPNKCCKWRLLEINIHFAAFIDYPLLASKRTFARIVYLRQGGWLVEKKGTLCVKNLAEKMTRLGDEPVSRRVYEEVSLLVYGFISL